MKITVGAVALITALLVGCAGTESHHTAPTSSLPHSWAPAQRGDGWEVASARDVGFNTDLLDSMTAALRRSEEYSNVHAVLIARDDHLVYEQYFSGEDQRWLGGDIEKVSIDFNADTLHDSRSVGKSITSALVGIALGSGAISSLDMSLVDFFPEHAALVNPEKRRITLRHALTMSAGLEWNEADVPYTNPRNHEEQMNRHADPAEFVLARSVIAEPGSTWYYNSGLPVLVGMAVSRATGQPLGAYALEVLFEPLGISDVEWGWPSAWTDVPELRWQSARGWAQVVTPAGNVWLRPRDLAKFGSLYLNDGRWNGRQVLPVGWAEDSTRRRLPVGLRVNDRGEYGYGYFWWHDVYHTPEGGLEVHTAAGNGGQRVYAIPALDMLVIVLAGGYNDPEAFWMPERLLLNYIVPSVRRETPQ